MKKICMLGILAFSLVACGEKYPYTSDSKKKEIIQNVKKLDRGEESLEALGGLEIIGILTELEELEEKGDKKAVKELEKWEKLLKEAGVDL